jgi:membrane-associated protease RseP (regulator of RpoE activity)
MRTKTAKLALAMAVVLTVAVIPAVAEPTSDPVIAPAPPAQPGDPPRPLVAPAAEPATAWVMQSSGSYLGVDTRDVTKERMAALKLKEERGVEITLVDHDAPAGKAGLKVGDVILEFNGQRVESQEQLRRLIREMPPGRTVTLGISRDGQPLSIQATLGDRRKMARTYGVAPMPPMPKIEVHPRIEMPQFSIIISDQTRTGLLVENLTPQLGEFFGVKNGEGVLVRSVEKGSAAETAGFRAGDVIIKVAEYRVARISDWRSAVRKSKGTVTVAVVRDKREQALSLTLPERRAGSEEDSSFYIDIPDEMFELDLEELEPRIMRLRDRIAIQARNAAVESALEVEEALREARRELERELERLDRELKSESEMRLKQEQKALREKQKALEKQKQSLEEKRRSLEQQKEKKKVEPQEQ